MTMVPLPQRWVMRPSTRLVFGSPLEAASFSRQDLRGFGMRRFRYGIAQRHIVDDDERHGTGVRRIRWWRGGICDGLGTEENGHCEGCVLRSGFFLNQVHGCVHSTGAELCLGFQPG